MKLCSSNQIDITVRRALLQDQPAIGELFALSSCHELPNAGFAAVDLFKIALRGFRGELWVAEDRSEIRGFVAWRPGEVLWLYVHPSSFRRGIGRMLLRLAKASGYPLLHVRVLADNHPMRMLCVGEGYRDAARETVILGDPAREVPVHLMRWVRPLR